MTTKSSFDTLMGFIFPLTLTILLIVTAAGVYSTIKADDVRDEHELRHLIYPAYVKASGDHGLTYDEWKSLYHRRLLPGQYHNRK